MNYIEYFKTKKGFHRFLLALKQKYEKSGSFTGTIPLNNITEEEQIAFSRFFGENFITGSNIKIPLKKIDRVIEKSNFKDFDYYKLITEFFELEAIKTKKEQRIEKEEKYQTFIEETLKSLQNKEFVEYLISQITNKTETAKIIRLRYTKNQKILKQDLQKIDKLLNNIPKVPISLPIFASLTGNPHFLDFNTNTGTLFLHFLGEMKQQAANKTEEKWSLLEMINVYSDTLSNYTITNHLLGEKEIENFNTSFGPLILNVENIKKINKISGINNQIFIFENPSLLNYFKNENISMMITSGNPNLSFYNLIKKVTPETKIYYNGDFDPEGLLIADKLKKLYPHLTLFCYEKEDYDNTKASEKISKMRLKKLEAISTPELNKIKEEIEIHKMSGYQEKNIKNIENYIKIKMDVQS